MLILHVGAFNNRVNTISPMCSLIIDIIKEEKFFRKQFAGAERRKCVCFLCCGCCGVLFSFKTLSSTNLFKREEASKSLIMKREINKLFNQCWNTKPSLAF